MEAPAFGLVSVRHLFHRVGQGRGGENRECGGWAFAPPGAQQQRQSSKEGEAAVGGQGFPPGLAFAAWRWI